MDLEEALAEIERLAAKISESNKHTKAAEAATDAATAAAKAAAEAATLKAAEDDKERLRSTNNHEQLVKTLEEEAQSSKRNIAALTLGQQDLINAHAQQLSDRDRRDESVIDSNTARDWAGTISTCSKRSPVLADKMKPFIQHREGKQVILDADGNVRDITKEAFILEVQTNPANDFLIDGVDSSGGRAPGNNNSGGASNANLSSTEQITAGLLNLQGN